jgi:hypothetical protein
LLDAENPADSIRVEKGSIGRVPFDPAGAPVTLVVRGRRIPA